MPAAQQFYTDSFVANDKRIEEDDMRGFFLSLAFKPRKIYKTRDPQERRKATEKLKKVKEECKKAQEELKNVEEELDKVKNATGQFEDMDWDSDILKDIKSNLQKFDEGGGVCINCINYKELEKLLAGKVDTLYYVDDEDTILREVKLK